MGTAQLNGNPCELIGWCIRVLINSILIVEGLCLSFDVKNMEGLV